MLFILKSYVLIWASWYLLLQGLGRFYSIQILAYGVMVVSALGIWLFRSHFQGSDFQSLKNQFKTQPVLLKSACVLFFSVQLLTVIFQLPLDWDGMDYHLPPIIESVIQDRWIRPDNPYFAVRSYPKLDTSIALLWLAFVKDSLGLRASLVLPMIHFLMGIFATYLFTRRSFWAVLFFVSFPLVARQAVAYYADLPALVFAVLFLLFFKQKEYFFAAIAIGMHSAFKFTGLYSGPLLVAGAALFEWLQAEFKLRKVIKHQFIYYSFAMFLFSGLQILENWHYEEKPFGELKCVILGQDYCGGSILPVDLILEPIAEGFKRDDSYIKRVFKSLMPSHAIPHSDVPTGGFGFLFFLSIFLVGVSIRKNHTPEWKLLLICAGLQLFIPGHWYLRYHMVFAFLVMLLGASVLEYDTDEYKMIRFYGSRVAMFLVVVQLLWLTPHRTWFLGLKDVDHKLSGLFENMTQIAQYGVFKHATHPADRRTAELFLTQNSVYEVCGNGFRPVLPAYGADLSNRVLYSRNCQHHTDRPVYVIGTTQVFKTK